MKNHWPFIFILYLLWDELKNGIRFNNLLVLFIFIYFIAIVTHNLIRFIFIKPTHSKTLIERQATYQTEKERGLIILTHDGTLTSLFLSIPFFLVRISVYCLWVLHWCRFKFFNTLLNIFFVIVLPILSPVSFDYLCFLSLPFLFISGLWIFP